MRAPSLASALARQKYWEISLSVEPKISTLCNSKNLLRTTKRLGELKALLVLTCSLQSLIQACDSGAFGL